MEGSAATAPAGDAPSGGEAQESQQQQGAPDLSALQSQLEGLTSSQEQMRGLLEQAVSSQQEGQQPAEEQQTQQENPDLSFLLPQEPGYDENQAAELLGQVIQQQAQQHAEQSIAPLAQQIQDMRVESEAAQLAQEFPELAEPGKAEDVLKLADSYAEKLGKPELAALPGFWRLVYMSGRAAELANEESTSSVGTATLEGAGGASPGAPDAGQMTEEALTTGGRRNPLPF